MEKKIEESEKIWGEISNLPIQVFALAGQKVEQHVTKLLVPGKVLFLKLRATSVLPALEEAIGNKYTVEVADGYICVKRSEDQAEVVKSALEKLLK